MDNYNNNSNSIKISKDDNFNAYKENFISNNLEKNFKRSFVRKSTNPTLLNNSKKNFENLEKNIFEDKLEMSKKSSWKNSKNNIDLNIKKVFFIPHIDNKEYENTNVKLKVTNTLTSSNQNEQNEYELKFYRNELELRNSYIEKLVVKGIMRPNEKENQKSHNSLIIFDWDDTLLPTSFLTKNGIYNENLILSNSDQEKIKKLENTVFGILSKALDRGDVFIITNAGPGWVEYSAEKYYPKIVSINDRYNSARLISQKSKRLFQILYLKDAPKKLYTALIMDINSKNNNNNKKGLNPNTVNNNFGNTNNNNTNEEEECNLMMFVPELNLEIEWKKSYNEEIILSDYDRAKNELYINYMIDSECKNRYLRTFDALQVELNYIDDVPIDVKCKIDFKTFK